MRGKQLFRPILTDYRGISVPVKAYGDLGLYEVFQHWYIRLRLWRGERMRVDDEDAVYA